MYRNYFQTPILGFYYYPRPQKWTDALIGADLHELAKAGIRQVWLFYDPYYDLEAGERLRWLMDECQRLGLTVVPCLGQFLQLETHPEVKIVNGDGSTSDDPRYWNMGCFRHPKVFELAVERSTRFFREFSDHPALYRWDGIPAMNFVHEAYYRNSVPEFGGEAMKPNCYCEHCREAFRRYLNARGLDPALEPPRDPADPVLWQHWLNCHAEAIPEFLVRLIAATKAVTPLWATHECNDFYPASWQCVYTGNDFWRMAPVLDFGHEDMYPLEFDHRYQCYVYNYTKDVLRSAIGFDKLITANGQAFNSWLGYRLPENSMSEQIYSCIAHGALGLVWWGEFPGEDPDQRYHMLRKTTEPNAQYETLVRQLEGLQPEPASIALLYSWTTMSQARTDDHTYDTLLTYQMLSQSGYRVDVLSEGQVEAGVLKARNYRAFGVMGASALPPGVRLAVDQFVRDGGLLLTDYAVPLDTADSPFTALYPGWHSRSGETPRAYTLSEGIPVAVQLKGMRLILPKGAEILGAFEDGSPALCRIKQGQGQIILVGSYLGWDYTNYPGYYDLSAMFPFHIRRDAALRVWLAQTLSAAGISPRIASTHADVETALWWSADQRKALLVVINHLQQTVQTEVEMITESYTNLREALTGKSLSPKVQMGKVSFPVQLAPLEGRAFWAETL
ncbi:MAG: hypothetical protein IT322_20100 [Anaerolineae bacterium]|nr:hypothetical protein [Anaerolineae bacterium]